MGERRLSIAPDVLITLDEAARRARADHPALRGNRTLSFPHHRSVGTVYVRDPRPATGAWEPPFDPSLWEDIGPATGDVGVPAAKEVGLKVEFEASGDLDAVASLPPGALQAISLARTRVTDDSLANLAHRPLLDLNLAGTSVGDRGIQHVAGMTSLQTLDLWGTRITDHGLAMLSGLRSLRSLDLWGTHVSDAGLLHLDGLSSLTRLYVPGRRVTAEGVAYIGRCRALRALDLSGACVGNGGLALLGGLQSLEVLYLWDSGIADAGLAHLSLLPGIVELDLGRNPVTDAGLRHLAALPSLQRVHLWNTAVTRAGLDSLRRAMPDLYIYM